MGYTNQLHPFFSLSLLLFPSLCEHPPIKPKFGEPITHNPPSPVFFPPLSYLHPLSPASSLSANTLPIFYVLSILWISANNRSEGSLGTWGMLKLWSRPVRFEKKRKKGGIR